MTVQRFEKQHRIAGVEGKEVGFEYDSEDDFDEPGFTMDVSTKAEEELGADRPKSRLQAALQMDPRGATPAPGDANVLGVLAANTAVTTESLSLLLDANPGLAGHAVGPEDAEPDDTWPYPLSILALNPSIGAIDPAALRRLANAFPHALTSWCTVECPGTGKHAVQGTPIHLLCMNPFATSEQVVVMIECTAEREKDDDVSDTDSMVHRAVETVAEGSRNGGSCFDILCSNPGPGLAGCLPFLDTFPGAATPSPPVWPEAEGDADECSVREFCANGGTSLHRVAQNPAVNEEILSSIVNAAPESAVLIDEHGCLPIHYLAANPGRQVDVWTFTRLIERTPACCLGWATTAPQALSVFSGYCGRLVQIEKLLSDSGATRDGGTVAREDDSEWKTTAQELLCGANAARMQPWAPPQ